MASAALGTVSLHVDVIIMITTEIFSAIKKQKGRVPFL